MKNSKIPQFVLECTKTDYPNHLCLNTKYKVDTTQRDNDNSVVVYWYCPLEYDWVCIGYFPLGCFNTLPIKQWIAKKKGVPMPEKPVRQRQQQVNRQRQRQI